MEIVKRKGSNTRVDKNTPLSVTIRSSAHPVHFHHRTFKTSPQIMKTLNSTSLSKHRRRYEPRKIIASSNNSLILKQTVISAARLASAVDSTLTVGQCIQWKAASPTPKLSKAKRKNNTSQWINSSVPSPRTSRQSGLILPMNPPSVASRMMFTRKPRTLHITHQSQRRIPLWWNRYVAKSYTKSVRNRTRGV